MDIAGLGFQMGREGGEGAIRPLKLLVVGLNYAPDFIGIPKYTTELCEDLVRRGHEVEVVTAPPYYPDWKIPDAYRNGWRREVLNGVKLNRVPIYVPKSPSGATRLLHHLSFAITALPAAISAARRFKPDIVLAIAPSLLSAPAALAAAKSVGAKSWLHIQDFEIDAAFDLGFLKGNLAHSWATKFESALIRMFDRVSTISKNMRDLVLRKGVAEASAIEFRNWVDVDAIEMRSDSMTGYRSELAIPSDHAVALYSGNMAGKQGLETLGDVAIILAADDTKVTFVFSGQGPVRPVLERACAGMANVRFIDLQPTERFSELLATADIHLLPQRAEAADLVLPSKLTGMLASGRAIVAMATPGTGLAEEVEGCGVLVPPGDASAMAQAIRMLVSAPAQRKSLGQAARARAEHRWRRSAVIAEFEHQLIALNSRPNS